MSMSDASGTEGCTRTPDQILSCGDQLRLLQAPRLAQSLIQFTVSIDAAFQKSNTGQGLGRVEDNGSGEGGIRTPTEILEKIPIPAEGGAKSGALAIQTGSIDPALATLIEAWPKLPEPIRAGILAMVRAAGG
jgi:hypothetical protein